MVQICSFMKFLKLLQRKFFFYHLSLIVDAAHHIISHLFTVFILLLFTLLAVVPVDKNLLNKSLHAQCVLQLCLPALNCLSISCSSLCQEVRGLFQLLLAVLKFLKMWTLLEAKSRQQNETSLYLSQSMTSWPKDFMRYEVRSERGCYQFRPFL